MDEVSELPNATLAELGNDLMDDALALKEVFWPEGTGNLGTPDLWKFKKKQIAWERVIKGTLPCLLWCGAPRVSIARQRQLAEQGKGEAGHIKGKGEKGKWQGQGTAKGKAKGKHNSKGKA